MQFIFKSSFQNEIGPSQIKLVYSRIGRKKHTADKSILIFILFFTQGALADSLTLIT